MCYHLGMNSEIQQLADGLLKLPAASRVDLAERLLESVADFTTPEVEIAWRNEVTKRVREYESGAVEGVPATDVYKAARERVNEARDLSP